MAECRYCAFARCHDGDPVWCAMALVMPEGEHACPAYEREPGSDDDKGEILDIPQFLRRGDD